MFRTLLAALRGPSLAERERAYLEEARDLYDLEYRQRLIDRGLFRGQRSWMEGPALF
jgi:hypothetical protein